MSNERMIYLYGLVDPETRQVRYVGQSMHPVRRRKEHIADSRHLVGSENPHGHPRKLWIADLLERSMEPELVILDAVPESAAGKAEERWMACYQSEHLTNADDPKPRIARGERSRPNRRNGQPVRQWSQTQGIDPAILVAFREKHGLSQGALARLLGVHYSAVSLWESGKRRVPKHIEMALNSLKIPPPES